MAPDPARHPRRRFLQGGLVLAGLGLLSSCNAARLPWQQPARVPRLGYLGAGLLGPYPALLDAFREGLRELDYVEGQTITIEYRYTDNQMERAPELAAELVTLGVDVIVATGGEAAAIASNATATIPIVGTILGPDPVGAGLVASFARPGGNVTGLSPAPPSGLGGKRLQLLKEAIPSIQRVAMLWNANNPAKVAELKEAESAAPLFGIEAISVEVRRDTDFEGAFQTLAAARADALIVIQDPLTFAHSSRITVFAAAQRLPAIYEVRLWTEAGGLMNYGVNSAELFRRAATYVDKILKGVRPADLPVEQPTKLEFVINLRTAQALGLSIPQSVLQQATELIR